MVKFRNKLTGGDMFVDESRIEEYTRAGHVPACAASEQATANLKSQSDKPKRRRKA